MGQHTKKVLGDKYELPSQQRAMVQITRFWHMNDPIKQDELKRSVIGSQCNGNPKPIDSKPETVVSPDCRTPSGCLWCSQHRDVDSFDYIWSILTMRFMKSIEGSSTVSNSEVPADLVIERLSDKINWFKSSSKKRKNWVAEAELRIEEGRYHQTWERIIVFLGY